MAKISRTAIEEVLLRTDIENLIAGYVSLKRAGSVYKGLCPFHSEKSPSFMVYPATNSFYCFGCGIGGDAITFVKQMEHLDYPDAIEFLAKRAGIAIIREDSEFDSIIKKYDKNRMFKMNSDAANYFHRALFSDLPGARDALTYFTEKRKLTLATIKHFGLGYAPDSFDKFSAYMISKGYTYDELVAGFLSVKTDKGKYYDAFRKRAMFPIIDVSGNVIAFGGRAIDDEVKPKYKNSSDTPVFKKSRNLFALNFARKTCQNELILCEGYMDVIALHAAGYTNAVATLGTAITAEQARLMSRYTKRVIVCYDSDEPGRIAANKALRILGEVGLESRVIVIPGSKDPDEYIKTYGNEKFKTVLEGAKLEFEYNMDNILAKFDINIPQDKITALKMIENEISKFYSEAEREIYIQIVANKLEIDAKSIRADIRRIVAKGIRETRKGESQRVIQASIGYSDKVNPDFAKAPSIAKNEELILGLLLVFPEHRKRVFDGMLLNEEDFFTAFNKRVFKYVKDTYSDPESSSDINEVFTAEEVGRITKMKLARMKLTENGDKILIESINSLKSSMQRKADAKASNLDELQALIEKMRKSEG